MRTALSLVALSLLAASSALADTGAPPAGRDAPATARRRPMRAAPGDNAGPETGPAGKAPDAANSPAAPAAGVAPVPVLSTPRLDSQALENKDPALAADRKAVEALKQEKAMLEAEIALADSKRRAELYPLVEERSKLEAARALRSARLAAKNAELEAEKARLERRIAMISAEANESVAAKNIRIRTLEGEARLLRAETDAAGARSVSTVALRRANDEADRVAAAEPVYLDDPVKDGVLTISDRRIPFNGVVSDTLADFVEKRLEFFNNKDPKKPVFIVIDNSPGGSVFSGLRILKAMKSSRAPVIVVVKQYAASMAAITTTMADRSYCYPNTIVLHHQMSTGFQGNMTDLRQTQKFTEDLYERTFGPVYTKLGYKSSADFEADMYRHFVKGDWAAFGDEAVRMKWVTATVDRIVETGVRELPSDKPASTLPIFALGSVGKRDENGRPYFELPPLTATGDAWALHDPEGRFRAR